MKKQQIQAILYDSYSLSFYWKLHDFTCSFGFVNEQKKKVTFDSDFSAARTQPKGSTGKVKQSPEMS